MFNFFLFLQLLSFIIYILLFFTLIVLFYFFVIVFFLCFFFFFQAEDGIRDPLVTGVQTCALPISFQISKREMQVLEALSEGFSNAEIAKRLLISRETVKHHLTNLFNKTGASNRSEERRVGKECRSRWSTYH